MVKMQAFISYLQVSFLCDPWPLDGILKCDHSVESQRAVLVCDAASYAVQNGSNLKVCGKNPKVRSFKGSR